MALCFGVLKILHLFIFKDFMARVHSKRYGVGGLSRSETRSSSLKSSIKI